MPVQKPMHAMISKRCYQGWQQAPASIASRLIVTTHELHCITPHTFACKSSCHPGVQSVIIMRVNQVRSDPSRRTGISNDVPVVCRSVGPCPDRGTVASCTSVCKGPVPAAQFGSGCREQGALCDQPTSLASPAGCCCQGRAQCRGWGVCCICLMGSGASGRKGKPLGGCLHAALSIKQTHLCSCHGISQACWLGLGFVHCVGCFMHKECDCKPGEVHDTWLHGQTLM